MMYSRHLPEPMTSRMQRCLRAIVVLTLALLPIAGLQAATDQDIQVRVKKNGPEVAVDVDCPVNASAAVTWEFLTDYDHMSEFLSASPGWAHAAGLPERQG